MKTVQVGDRITAKFATLNKNNSLGQYITECGNPELDENGKYWDKKQREWIRPNFWRIELCQIDKIIDIDAQEYFDMATSLLEDRTCFSDGGFYSDYKVPEEMKDFEFFQLPEDQRDKWRAQSYRCITLVRSPGLPYFVVDAQGYKYARYVGIEPQEV